MDERKAMHYAFETLNLLCEWESCSEAASDIEIFICHISKKHLSTLEGVDLHCHWKDCEAFAETLPELRRHILLHAFHTKIKCHGRNLQRRKNIPDCSLSIQSRNIIPELPEPLVCCWNGCMQEFECTEHYYRHVDYHSEYDTEKDNLDYIICFWLGCSRNFTDNHKLKEHLRSHTQEKLIACPTCGGMFSSRTKFFDHIQRQLPLDENNPDGVYVCEYCSRRMNSERLLRDHMRHHVNHYKCPYCDMTCPTPSGLQCHVSYRHSDSKPHACQYCEYRCKSENDLRKHLETHNLNPTYQCPVEGCAYATRSHTCYTTHYRKKHDGKQPAKYSCHLCEKLCTRGNYLTKHLINHHKFKWPSGHCRFRYQLHEDGFYRLQTVRYESVELSEKMMSESSEVLSGSQILDTQQENTNNLAESFSDNQSNNFVSSEKSSASYVICIENLNEVNLQDNTSIINSAVSSPVMHSEEPVLINIVDTEDKSPESGGSVLLIKTPRPFVADQTRSVQLITKDLNGKVIVETAEIITQYDPSLAKS